MKVYVIYIFCLFLGFWQR